MKVVVIGTINQDLILPFRGTSIQSIGGIFYTISALSKLGGQNLKIVPISYLGSDMYPAFLRLLKQYPNVLPDGLQEIDQKNHKVILEYKSAEERVEKALFNFPSLEWGNLENFLDADFYMVNLITGWDISLAAYQELSRLHYRRMYLDVHFLVMGIDKLGKRFPQRPANVDAWIRGARFVQMNEREFRIISGNSANDILFFENYFKPDQILIITLGSKGARVIFRKDDIVRKKEFPAYPVEDVVDVTGCGDVFGAGFVTRYLRNGNLYQAIEYANRAAGVNSLLRGTNELDRLLPLMDELAFARDNG